jgi:hypothetical protein
MKREVYLCCLVAAMFLGGCATAYQPAGGTGGYVDRKIDDQTYHVQFSGNGYTSRDRVHKYFMYRCAELTQRAGFKYFTIVPAALSGAVSPDKSLVSGIGFDPRMMRKVGTAIVPVYIYGSGGGAQRWSDNADIRMFNDDAVINERVVGWDVDEILEQLGPYVRSDGKTPVELPAGWVFESGHSKIRAQDLLPTSPKKEIATGM